MTLNEMFLDSLEGIESFYLDYETVIKPITKEMYVKMENLEIKNYYLDIKDNKPIIVIQLADLHIV